jgi:hypothetical protein
VQQQRLRARLPQQRQQAADEQNAGQGAPLRVVPTVERGVIFGRAVARQIDPRHDDVDAIHQQERDGDQPEHNPESHRSPIAAPRVRRCYRSHTAAPVDPPWNVGQ